MSSSDPRSWPDRLLSACLMFLVAAVAVSVAVRLIEAVWTALLSILIAAGVVTLAVLVIRARTRNW